MVCSRKKERDIISWVCWHVASHGGAQIFSSKQLKGDVISSPSCLSWRFHFGRTSLPRVSCLSVSGAGELCSSRKKTFTGGNLIFIKDLMELVSGSLDSGVSNEILPSHGCSPKDMLPEFGGEIGCSGKMKRSDWDHLYFLKKC